MYDHRTHIEWVATINHDMARCWEFGCCACEHLYERNVYRAALVPLGKRFPIPDIEHDGA